MFFVLYIQPHSFSNSWRISSTSLSKADSSKGRLKLAAMKEAAGHKSPIIARR
jgi:hypothetical protein